MLATLALVVVQRPVETAHRSWLGLVGGRGVLAALSCCSTPTTSLRRPEPAGPEDPKIRALAEHLTEEGALFYGASWCPHCQEQKLLFGASGKPPSVHRMQPRWTQYPAGAVVQQGRRAELSNVGHQRPGLRRAGIEPGRTCRDIAVSRRGDFQPARRCRRPVTTRGDGGDSASRCARTDRTTQAQAAQTTGTHSGPTAAAMPVRLSARCWRLL